MKQRILAIIGAVALVGVALVLRGVLADDDTGGAGGSGGGSNGALPVVACSPGLQVICETLADEGYVDPAVVSFDLGSPASTTGVLEDEQVDAWITWDPAGPISNFDAEDGEPVWAEAVPVGSSPLAIGAKAPLEGDGCAGPTTWSCVVNQVGEQGAAVAVGRPDRIDGLVRLHPVAMATLDDDDLIEDIDAALLDSIVSSSTQTPGPFASELSAFAVRTGAYELIVGPAVALRERDVATVVTPAGDDVMTLVVTPRTDGSTTWIERAFDDDAVREAVRAAGVEPGTGTLADETRAGELYALRQEIGS